MFAKTVLVDSFPVNRLISEVIVSAFVRVVLCEYLVDCHLISMCKMWLKVVVVAPFCDVVDAQCSLSVNKSAAVDQ